MSENPKTFATQADTRGNWRRFIDEIVPLRPDLFRYCCALTGNVWDGEDLVQDALARVFSLMGKINVDIAHPRAYLVRAATHLWIDQIRRARLERAYTESAAGDEAFSGDDPAQATAVREATYALFARLPPRERTAVLLKDVLDFSLEETAAMLKSSVGAVKAALHRGRAKLNDAQRGETAAPSSTPRAVVDQFVAALAAKDIEAIHALCLADVTVDMVGGARMEDFAQGKPTLEHAHFVMPQWGFGESPHWKVVDYAGEPIAIGFRTLDNIEGLNEIWRLEMGEAGKVERIRLYCFTPDVLAAVAKDLGITALKRPYRSPP
jgi:RNA polymerase sigma-70 factor (ECF subfamily)